MRGVEVSRVRSGAPRTACRARDQLDSGGPFRGGLPLDHQQCGTILVVCVGRRARRSRHGILLGWGLVDDGSVADSYAARRPQTVSRAIVTIDHVSSGRARGENTLHRPVGSWFVWTTGRVTDSRAGLSSADVGRAHRDPAPCAGQTATSMSSLCTLSALDCRSPAARRVPFDPLRSTPPRRHRRSRSPFLSSKRERQFSDANAESVAAPAVWIPGTPRRSRWSA